MSNTKELFDWLTTPEYEEQQKVLAKLEAYPLHIKTGMLIPNIQWYQPNAVNWVMAERLLKDDHTHFRRTYDAEFLGKFNTTCPKVQYECEKEYSDSTGIEFDYTDYLFNNEET